MQKNSSLSSGVKTDYDRILRNAALRRRAAKTGVYAMLVIWGLIVLFPFYWMVLSSLKTQAAYDNEQTPVFFITNPAFENYVKVFTSSDINLGRYILNTLIFTLGTTALMMAVIIPAAFAFARLEFKGKNLVFGLLLSLMMIPTELVVITNFQTITAWNMRDSFPGLILPSVTSVFYIYLLKENFAQIPDELYKAARVDGTSDFKYLMTVMIPISRPTIVTITILKVIECWNSFVWPRLITKEPDYYLISQGIQQIRESGLGRENIPGMMAAVVIVSLPLIVLFLIFRNQVMEGVSRGGTKG
ncbi:MAG: carbohydrate ABC transporter permease [Clostridia bacterium]|nr:carbohydrate ABC transporter permease [Clostridia bacterium]